MPGCQITDGNRDKPSGRALWEAPWNELLLLPDHRHFLGSCQSQKFFARHILILKSLLKGGHKQHLGRLTVTSHILKPVQRVEMAVNTRQRTKTPLLQQNFLSSCTFFFFKFLPQQVHTDGGSLVSAPSTPPLQGDLVQYDLQWLQFMLGLARVTLGTRPL